MHLLLALHLASVAASGPALVFADQPSGSTVAHVRATSAGGTFELARIEVAPDALPVGTVSPDGRSLALAFTPPSADRVQRGALVVVDLTTHQVRRLASDLLALERPRFTSDGKRVLFIRLRDFAEPPPERMRQGELGQVTTEVWSAALDGSGERLVASVRAFGINLAGVLPGRVLLYRVSRDGAFIDEVSDTGGTVRQRLVLPHGPFARDFSVVDDALVLATLSERATRTFAVESYALSTGERRVLAEGRSDHLRPLATRSGLLLSRPTPDGNDDLARLGADAPLLAAQRGRWLTEAATPDLATIAARRLDAGGGHLVLWHADVAREVATEEQFEVFGFGQVRP